MQKDLMTYLSSRSFWLPIGNLQTLVKAFSLDFGWYAASHETRVRYPSKTNNPIPCL